MNLIILGYNCFKKAVSQFAKLIKTTYNRPFHCIIFFFDCY